MDLKPNILIFSVFQKDVSEKMNISRHMDTMVRLQRSGIPCMELQGKYNGSSEMSILVTGFEHRADVEYFCREFHQECYLESHNDRATFLVYPDGKTQSIGTLTAVPKEEAESIGSFSYNPVVDQYFVTR